MKQFSHIDDPAVGALPVLLGPEAAEVLGAALSPAGGRVRSLHITQIRYTPGRAIVVRYRVDVGWDDGRSTREVVVAASGERIPDGPIVLSSGDTEISVWSYPHDPALPGLAVITDEQRAKGVFGQLGIASAAAPRLRLRAYRPLRRAVLEAATPRGKVFFKLVRPSAVADLQAKHQALSAAVPVPQSQGWNADLGLVALQAMPGKPLRRALESGTRRLPVPGDYPSLLDRLPDLGEVGGRVSPPERRAAFHARLLKRVVPDLAGRIDAILSELGDPPDEDEVPVHGDFHSSQLLIKGSSLVGLIDVDTAGRGARSNDLATLLAHMSAVGLSTAARRHIDRYGRTLIDEFDQHVEPSSLRRKVGAVILGLATGPFRVNMSRWAPQTERRVALAERWMNSAADI